MHAQPNPTVEPAKRGRTGGRWRGPAVVLGLLVSAGLVWQSSQAAFTATTRNDGNQWTAGEVALSSAPSAVMFNAVTVKPDDPKSQCIEVTYDGNLATDGVELYTAGIATADGGSDGAVLDDQLMMKIQIGGGGDTCATADKSGWAHLATASGWSIDTLSDLTGWGDSIDTGWAPSAANELRAFYFTHELPTSGAVNDAQGDSVSIDFVWETQNA